MTAPPVLIREAGADDFGFLVDTWRRSFSEGDSSALHAFDRDVYFRLMARHIKALSREPGAVCVVACDPGDPDTVVGFAMLTGTELQYVYVRASFRKMGIARLLLEGRDVKTYAFKTRQGLGRLRPEARGWTYAPRTAVWADGKVRVEMA